MLYWEGFDGDYWQAGLCGAFAETLGVCSCLTFAKGTNRNLAMDARQSADTVSTYAGINPDGVEELGVRYAHVRRRDK